MMCRLPFCAPEPSGAFAVQAGAWGRLVRVIHAVRDRLDPPLTGALLLAVGTVLLAIWVSVNIFDRLPHVEDEVAFVFQARTFAEGEIVAEPPERPEFFRIPFVIVRGDMWFGKYPPGYPLVLAAGVLAGVPWLVNPLLGGVAVLLVFVVGRRLYDAPTALGAAALLAISPFLMLQAGSMMSHVAALVWTLLALLAFEAVVRRGAAWPAVGCGAALGMLALTRSLTAAGIGLPIGIWLLAMIVRDRRNLRLAGCVAGGALPFVIALLAYNWYTTGSPFQTGYELWWDWDRIGFGEGISRDRNYTLYEAWDNMKSNVGDLSMYLYGWPARLSVVPAVFAAALAVYRAVVWWRRPRRRRGAVERNANLWDLFLAGTVASLICVHLIYWTDGQMYGPRYYFEIIGALALLTSRGLIQAATVLSERIGRAGLSRATAQATALSAILVVVTLLSLHNARNFSQARFDEFRDWYGINRDGLETVDDAGITHAIVFVKVETWSEYAPFFLESAPALDGDIIYAIDRGPAANRRLLADYPGREAYVFEGGRIVRVGMRHEG
jgi:4-amino-4-deoxy-L-arabinose transferase-like glycosyltransferase